MSIFSFTTCLSSFSNSFNSDVSSSISSFKILLNMTMVFVLFELFPYMLLFINTSSFWIFSSIVGNLSISLIKICFAMSNVRENPSSIRSFLLGMSFKIASLLICLMVFSSIYFNICSYSSLVRVIVSMMVLICLGLCYIVGFFVRWFWSLLECLCL